MRGASYRSVFKAFGETQVLRDITLQIEHGEFVVYVGPSGCGKTTLLRLLSGLESVTSGRIEIRGRDVTYLSPKARNVAMVFQNYALYPHMTVAENIGFGLKVRGMSRAERDRRVREAATLLGLEGLLQRKPRALSGGQRQRVAMGRSLVRQPDVFLLDEPLSNLDAQLRGHMRAEIKALHRRLAATMVYVTHDQVEAMTMADRIVVLRDGEIQQVGTPKDVYRRPVNRFVASFIGAPAMNFLDVVANGGAPSVAGAAALPDAFAGAAELGIRPQDLVIGDGAEQLPVKWRAVVDLVEPLGGETLLHANARDQVVRARIDGDWSGGAGEEIWIGFDPAAAYRFSAQGNTIGA